MLKELILLKVIEVRNVWFATIGVLIIDSNFKVLYAKFAKIWQFFCLNISDIAIITDRNVDYCCIIHKISDLLI